MPGILDFVYELRQQTFIEKRRDPKTKRKRLGTYIDLDPIEHVDIEGALLLAAELDRVRRIRTFRPFLDDQNWNPQIRAILYALGLHDVIEARRKASAGEIADLSEVLRSSGLSVVRFVSGSQVEGEKADRLQQSLIACSPASAEGRRSFYDGLLEAIKNAVVHAYVTTVADDGIPAIKRWWAGGLVDHTTGYLYLTVYDQGVGIPATLPLKAWWPKLVEKVADRSNDAAAIVKALEYGQSRFGQDGRGNGLWRMCQLVDQFADASVEILSLRGRVTRLSQREIRQEDLGVRFCGTMVGWRVRLQSAESPG